MRGSAKYEVDFEFEVWRPTVGGGESTKVLSVTCLVQRDYDPDEGWGSTVEVLSAKDDEGEEQDLTRYEEHEITTIALDVARNMETE